MFDLKCKRTGCVFNKSSNCTAKHIDVSKSTACETYEPSNEVEIGEVSEIRQVPIRKNIEVGCDAKCLFNQNHHCKANGITVQTTTNKNCPNCCTFQPE